MVTQLMERDDAAVSVDATPAIGAIPSIVSEPEPTKENATQRKERLEREADDAAEARRVELSGHPLLSFISALSPEHQQPKHLADWCELIERASRQPGIRGLCDVPIRHYKTETTMHGVIWLLVQDPTLEIIFLSHTLEAAQSRGKRLRQLATGAGVGPTRGHDTITHWQNERGGGVVVMSAAQSKIGYNCHALIVDDPIDEDAADDPALREVVDQTIAHYTARCMRRGQPGPVLILMSRWHPDDPIGRRLSRGGWEYIHHPVINGDGSAFAPDVWDLPELEKMRAELKMADPFERIWFAQLMGDPQPEGHDLFGAPTFYGALPTWAGWRVAHGVDFSYTDAPGSDFFAAVTGRIYGRKLYILDVQRHRLDATLLESTCKAIVNKYGRAPLWSYQSGPEVGLSRLLIERGLPVASMHARYNKLVRAQKTIGRWNAGDVLVPEKHAAPWVQGFLHRLSLFRGHEKDRDDEVDAMVSVCDAVLGGAPFATLKSLGLQGRKAYAGFLG
jgi:predicted phage terminase large subunit-like protein